MQTSYLVPWVSALSQDGKKPMRLCRPWRNSGTSLDAHPFRADDRISWVLHDCLGCAIGKQIIARARVVSSHFCQSVD
jgi:hypothetical protein